MKHTAKILTVLLAGTMTALSAFAGNEDRAGQAGATELLINPWARTSGWAGCNVAGVRGLEGQFLNAAGTAFTRKTEALFTHTNYLKGSDIGINAFGFSQKVGESGVLALGFTSMSFGNIDVTTTDMPEGGLGNYTISFMNIGVSYAKGFTDHIFGGMCVRGINQSIPDAKAGGLALDAGIQYVAGKTDNAHFGISLKNVGPKMQFHGDGLSVRSSPNGTNSDPNNTPLSVDQQSASFELPSQVNIGGAYDYWLGDDTANMSHRITFAAAFVSNSFTKDEFRLGLEYGFKSFLMLRAGYDYEKKDADGAWVNAHKGLSAGFTIELPLSKDKGTTFGLDYSYRATNSFDGTHSIGVRMNL